MRNGSVTPRGEGFTKQTQLMLLGRWCVEDVTELGETGPLSQGVQAGKKALRIRHINGMEVRKKVRKKRPRGFK